MSSLCWCGRVAIVIVVSPWHLPWASRRRRHLALAFAIGVLTLLPSLIWRGHAAVLVVVVEVGGGERWWWST